MILAQNHLQLLNGSKRLFTLILPLLLFSCGAFQQVVSQPTSDPRPEEEVVIDHRESDPTAVEPPATETEETAYRMVQFRGSEFKVPVHKQTFKIAVILPFHVGAKNAEQRMRSELMLEYYQGLKTALASLEDLESKFVISVYDSKNDSLVVKRILRKADMKRMDLIIGPTETSQVRIAAAFARKHKIFLFSPITVINCVNDNSYLFNLSPSNRMRVQEFIRFLKEQHVDKKLIVVRSGNRFDRSFGQALVNALDGNSINYQLVKSNRSLNWESYLTAEQNIVLHTSNDKSIINSAVTGLMPYKDKVQLIGSEKWLEFSSVDFSFWSQLSVHFLSSDQAELDNPMALQMRIKYREQFNGDPSSFAFAGYDHLTFAAELLNAFGEHFPVFIQDKSFAYANTRFTMVKQSHCYQNRFLEVLRFQDQALVPVHKP